MKIKISFFMDSMRRIPPLIDGAYPFLPITISGLVGALIPFVLKRFNIDPAVAAGPFITNFNDVISICIYLGLTTAMVMYLV